DAPATPTAKGGHEIKEQEMTLKANLIAAALVTAAIAAPTAQATDDGTLISQASRKAASATAPDIRQTDPRAAGSFITDTLAGNGHPAAAKGYRLITDT